MPPSPHPALARTDHRPWPLPAGRWTWRQRWCDLLFAHWPLPVEAIRPLVPPALEVDTFDGSAWVGVVPFRMEGIALRPFPPVPGFAAFPEINVRTYVHRDGKPGVWFLSLDASNLLAVWAARAFFHLPYHWARFRTEEDGGEIVYESVRRTRPRGLTFSARYGPTGPAYEARPGSPERWLTERYCLYAEASGGRLARTEVHHAPWPLQPARAAIDRNELGEPFGLELAGEAPLLHFSRALDVVLWPGERLGD